MRSKGIKERADDPAKIPQGIYAQMLQILMTSGFTGSEMKLIIEEWMKRLNLKPGAGLEQETLIADAKRALRALAREVKQGQKEPLVDCLNGLTRTGKYTKKELCDLMEENGMECDFLFGVKKKVFISHSSKDKEYAMAFVNFLEDIGLKKEQIFCSSVPEYGVPLHRDIYDYLKKQFVEYDTYVIYMLSENYYDSAACLNEMGAAWVLQKKYAAILLPGFQYKEIEGR